MSSTAGLTAVGPVALPKWLFFLRIAILVLSLAVLIAAAYNVSLLGGYYGASSTPAGFLIFDSIFTFIILGCMLGFEIYLHNFYYRLAFLVFLVLDVIFWLAAWAWAASWASTFGAYSRYGGFSIGNDAYYGSLTAATVLGAFVWILLIVVTYFFVRASLNDGHHGGVDDVNSAELGHTKHPETTTTPMAPVAPNGQPGTINPQYAAHPPPPEQQRYA